MAGQEEVSQGLASAQARIKALEAILADAHATVRPAHILIACLLVSLVAALRSAHALVAGKQQRHTLIMYVGCPVPMYRSCRSPKRYLTRRVNWMQPGWLQARRCLPAKPVCVPCSKVRTTQQLQQDNGARTNTHGSAIACAHSRELPMTSDKLILLCLWQS